MRVIAVTSGKGGTGQSCIAAYTAQALAAQGKTTLLIETGTGPKSQDIILGMQDVAVFDLADVFAGRCELEQGILQVGDQGNLYMIPGPMQPMPTMADGQWKLLLRALKKHFDFVILDGLDRASVPVKALDQVLLVLTPETLCIRACSALAAGLYDQGAKEIRLVINKVPPRVLPMQGIGDFDDIIDTVGAQLIGVLPVSQKLRYGANNSQPIDKESVTVQIFERLALRMTGKQQPLLIR